MKTVSLKILYTKVFDHLLFALESGVTSTSLLAENHQTSSETEKSTPDVGDASEHTDKHTSPRPLVSDDQPCREEGEREKGEPDDDVNSLEQTNNDV